MKSLKSGKKILFVLLFFFLIVFCSILYFLYFKTLAYILFAITIVFSISYLILYRQTEKTDLNYITGLVDLLDGEDRESLNSLNFPAILFDEDGNIIWFNELYKNTILTDDKDKNRDIFKYLTSKRLSETVLSADNTITIENKSFEIFTSKINSNRQCSHLYFFFEVTDLKNDSVELKNIRPSVMIGYYDNFDEMFQDYSDSEYNEIKNGIDKIVDSWLSEFNCISRKIGNDRFIVIVHENDLSVMKNNKFNIIQLVKDYKYNSTNCGISLSIGVGNGKNLKECEINARQSLDMALSRGGDQVAIKNNDNYEFFGGLSVGNTKTDKVRSRVVATGISQILNENDDVFVVGHKFSDMDSIGAAIGICAVVKQMGKNAYIVCDKEKTLSRKLIDYYISETNSDVFVDYKKIENKINKNSVLFVVDTHRKEIVEYPELLNKTKNIVIIDHHRKALDYIVNSVIFYHDPNASSCCEMITEILPYLMNNAKLQKVEAEALFAGIMLDTKNFVLRTGVRTFEAAAYLRKFGTDTVLVKELFSSSVDNYRLKNEIVSTASIYKNMAIAVTQIQNDNIRIITSQVADELLNISNVNASFVIYKTDKSINISARSFGNVNVQLIMERLGGGGHLTMSATQLKSDTIEEAINKLKNEIDYYLENVV